jgi:hypothetical protein
VMSESTENLDIGLGLPKLSLLNLSGRGGVGRSMDGGAVLIPAAVGDGTGLSDN